MNITAQHELFIEYFVELRNVKDAAESAGFDRTYGYGLFKKLRTQIEERLADEMIMMQAEAIAVTKESMAGKNAEGQGIIPAVQAIKQRAAETTMDRGSITKKQNLEVGVVELPAVMMLPEKDPDVPNIEAAEDDEQHYICRLLVHGLDGRGICVRHESFKLIKWFPENPWEPVCSINKSRDTIHQYPTLSDFDNEVKYVDYLFMYRNNLRLGGPLPWPRRNDQTN